MALIFMAIIDMENNTWKRRRAGDPRKVTRDRNVDAVDGRGSLSEMEHWLDGRCG